MAFRRIPIITLRTAICIVLIAVLSACGGGPTLPSLPPPGPGDRAHPLWVISNGWHTGIVLSRADIAPGLIPEKAKFPKARYLEFGWGDRQYYPAEEPTTLMAIEAALTSTPAVLHLNGRMQPPRGNGNLEVISFRVTSESRDRLTSSLHAAFDRPQGEGTTAPTVARGLYPDSLFFAANGNFHLFNTCNTWVARKLSTAGLPVDTDVITAEQLMERLRALSWPRAGADPRAGTEQGKPPTDDAMD